MKQTIKNYTFNAVSHTVTFSDFGSISLDRLFLVTNVTRQTIIYQFNDNALGGSVSGNILTLAYDTSGMDNSDKLQIIYDCATGDPVYDQAAASSVQGTVASGATDSGNPVKIGGVYRSSVQSLNDGQRSDILVDQHGYMLTTLGTALVAEDTATNAFRTEGTFTEMTGSAGALNADLIASTDVGIYSRFSLQLSGTWVGTVTVSCSNDNSGFNNLGVFNAASTAAVAAASQTTNGMYFGYINARYLRIRMTAYTSGTATATLVLFTTASTSPTMGVQAAQTGSWSFLPAIWGAASLSNVTATTSSTPLLASNTNRKAAYFFNDSSANLYLKLGATASLTSFSFKITAGNSLTLPSPPIYSGAIDGIWDAANGAVRISEL